MQSPLPIEAEIVIDSQGKVSVRNCTKELLEIAYQLNPNDTNLQIRMQLIQQLEQKGGITR